MTAASRIRRQLKLRNASAPPEPTTRSPQSQKLLEILNGAVLFQAPDQTTYAEIEVRDHRETWGVRSSGFRDWLIGSYLHSTGGAPNESAI